MPEQPGSISIQAQEITSKAPLFPMQTQGMQLEVMEELLKQQMEGRHGMIYLREPPQVFHVSALLMQIQAL